MREHQGFFALFAVIMSVLSFSILAACLRLMNRLSHVPMAPLGEAAQRVMKQVEAPHAQLPQPIKFCCGGHELTVIAPGFSYYMVSCEGRLFYAPA